MLRMSPPIEVSVWEEGGLFLGRRFFKPSELLTRKTNPEWVSLFRGDPNVEAGQLLCSLQVSVRARARARARACACVRVRVRACVFVRSCACAYMRLHVCARERTC